MKTTSNTHRDKKPQMPAKVLIVDDEVDFLEIMSQRLHVRGIDVSITTSTEKALDIIEKGSFDVVMMDCMMPGMEGFRALKQMKSIEPTLAVILLTAYIPEDQSAEAIKLGALAVIEKPAEINYLAQKIFEAKQRTSH